MADFEINDTVDITDVVCPVTFVKAKVALEELEDGEILAIRMNDGEVVVDVQVNSQNDSIEAIEKEKELTTT